MQEHLRIYEQEFAKILFALSDIKWKILKFVKQHPQCDIIAVAAQITEPQLAVVQVHLKVLQGKGVVAAQTAHSTEQTGEKRLLYSLASPDIHTAMADVEREETALKARLDPQLVAKIEALGRERVVRNRILCICVMCQHEELSRREIGQRLKERFLLRHIPANHISVLPDLVEAGILDRATSAQNLGDLYTLAAT